MVVTYLGSLVQSCCGEGGALQISLACVGSTRSVPAILGLPPLMARVLSPSTLLRLQAALQGAGPELRALPRPKRLGSGSRVLHKGAGSVGSAFVVPSQV